jgi:deoxycytidylate deaminase
VRDASFVVSVLRGVFVLCFFLSMMEEFFGGPRCLRSNVVVQALGGGAQPDSYFFVGVNVHSLFNACELRSVGCTLAGGQSIVVAWVVPVCNASLLL